MAEVAPEGGRAVPRPRRGREALVALGLALAALAAAELGLRAAGVAAPEPAEGAYLVPDPEVEGGWVTRLWPKGEFRETRVPPKGDARRALILGGSNAQSFPERHLERVLEERSGEDWEAYGLGRAGYGSDRVRRILEEAVARLAPDAVVLYTGDNEFIEDAEARARERDATALGRVAAVAGDLRLVRLLAPPPEPAAAAPEPVQRAMPALYAELSYDETLARLERLRANLLAMAGAAEAAGTELVLCTVVYNRFSPPAVSNVPPDAPEELEREVDRLRRRALVLAPEHVRRLAATRYGERLHLGDWRNRRGAGRPDASPEALAGRRPSHGRLAGVEAGLFAADRWSDKVFATFERLALLHARDLGGVPRERVEEAEALLARAVELAPEHPAAWFELGLVRYVLGRPADEVRRLLEGAASLDRAPRKASEVLNDVLRAVAAARPEVALVDADRLFADGSPDGLVGYEWLADECHLVPGGRKVVLEEAADAILARRP